MPALARHGLSMRRYYACRSFSSLRTAKYGGSLPLQRQPRRRENEMRSACPTIASTLFRRDYATPVPRRHEPWKREGLVIRKHISGKRPGDKSSDTSDDRKNSPHDRVAFAARVKSLLQKGKFEDAKKVVNAAETRGFDTIGGWNALLEYAMQQKEDAWKLFNNMKKRGRMPNAHTYTIMLRGYARRRSESSLLTAKKIYAMIGKPNSGVQPSTIHHNAMLEVCARHYNMDALWEVVSGLPDSGEGEPDSITYTTIINAIRAVAELKIAKLERKPGSGQEVEAKKMEAVRLGKGIWANVVQRWRSGALMPDQRLASAMARLLIFGGRDCDYLDALALLNQTMGIPLLVSKNSMARDKGSDVENAEKSEIVDVYRVIKEISGSQGRAPAEEPEPKTETETEIPESEEFRHLFDPVDINEVQRAIEKRSGKPLQRELLLPLPYNTELSLILEACQQLEPGLARKYWSILTSPDGDFVVQPDEVSYHHYLRNLRVSRSSAESLRVIRDEMAPRKLVSQKTFRIALSTCSRDRNNPHVLDTAGRLVELMNKTLPHPLVPALQDYMEIVRKWTAAALARGDSGEDALVDARRKMASITVDAVVRLSPEMGRLGDIILSSPGPDSSGGKAEPRKHDYVPGDLMSLFQNYQRLLREGFAEEITANAPQEYLDMLQTEQSQARRVLSTLGRSTMRRTA